MMDKFEIERLYAIGEAINRRCGDCVFVYMHEDTLTQGQCRRHAPTINSSPNGPQWPIVSLDQDWCGEIVTFRQVEREE